MCNISPHIFFSQEVYDVFLELDSNNTSYINEVGRNTTHLHNKMAMLLGHPLQRPIQMQASHSLIEEEEAWGGDYTYTVCTLKSDSMSKRNSVAFIQEHFDKY